jgi:nucleotide-binding universal stress UspA family protein
MNTILVPTDFSETANKALKVAVELSKKHGSKLILLHMLEISKHLLPDNMILTNDVQPSNLTHSDDLPEAIFYMKLAQKRFADIRELPFMEGVDYQEAVQNHIDFKGVIETAKKHEADLLIMGSHGTSGIEEIFVGSNTEKIVRYSDIPVLVIKDGNEHFKLENVVFASDFTDEAVSPFKKASSLFSALGAKIKLVYVNTPGDYFMSSPEMLTKVKSFLNKSGNTELVDGVTFVSDYTVEKGILNFASQNEIDAIAVATHGRTGISHFLSGSITEDIANHSTKPVVTFRIES